jgi:hypothetical protein
MAIKRGNPNWGKPESKKNFSLVVTRVNSPDSVLVVPFAKTLDFRIRREFKDCDFVVFLETLGIDSYEARLTLSRSRPAPRSFELRLALSEDQSRCLYFYFPLLVNRLRSVA